MDKDKKAFSELRTVHLMSVKTVNLSETQQADSINFLDPLLSVKIVQIVYWGITQQTDPIYLLGPLLTCLSVSLQFYFPMTHLTSCLVSALLDLLE